MPIRGPSNSRACTGLCFSGAAQISIFRAPLSNTSLAIGYSLALLDVMKLLRRCTAYHYPEGDSYIERFHRSLKEEEVWTAEYRSLEEARASIARWIEEYKYVSSCPTSLCG